ncbi:MAG: SGNH/GDSL hydrolase family protein [Silvania sp.]|uniref:SGNH/GDSL hydrolase family protein n=1 Tax=Silvania sp. TaxID=3016633 RepID=UPI003EE69564
MKRQIRLKEWEPGTKRVMAPPASLIELSDGSLPPDSVSVTISSDGFVCDPNRSDEFESRVIVMGDSVVECSYVPEGRRFTDIAEKELRAKGVSARVENAGRSGATILQLTLALQAKIIPMRPNKIVLMNGIIDADAIQFASGLWSKGDYINPIEEEKVGHPAPKKLPELDFTARTKFLRLFADTCRLFEIDLVIATTPLRDNDEYMERYLAKNGQRNIRVEAVNHNTREFCSNNGVKLIDLDKLVNRDPQYFYDYFHFNPAGAEYAGRLLAEGLLA